jgi:hypothetical protein
MEKRNEALLLIKNANVRWVRAQAAGTLCRPAAEAAARLSAARARQDQATRKEIYGRREDNHSEYRNARGNPYRLQESKREQAGEEHRRV